MSCYAFTESSPINLLGPYRSLSKLTLLDCTDVAKAREGNGSKVSSYFPHILPISMILAIIFRTAILFQVKGNTMSLTWAEANFFGFFGIHSMVCSFCVYGWTKNAFIPNHTKTLEHLRTLRVVKNNELDCYSKLHVKSAIFTLPLFLSIMFAAVYAAVHKKVIFSGQEASVYLIFLMPILAFFVWMIVSITVIFHTIVQVSINREFNYFNEELQKASNEKILTDLKVLTAFSSRQIELIKMVKQANDSLGSYSKWGPMFVFFAFVNIVYMTGFFDVVPLIYSVWVVFSLLVTIGINVTTFRVPAEVQEDVVRTSKILMSDDYFEKSENPKVYQTYRSMLDRSLNSDAKIYVCNAFPIVTQAFSISMLIIPNLPSILLMIKKVCGYNGITF